MCASQERGWDDLEWPCASGWTTGHATRTGLAWKVGVWNTEKVHVLVARIIRSAARSFGACVEKEFCKEINNEFSDKGDAAPPLSLFKVHWSGATVVEGEARLDIS